LAIVNLFVIKFIGKRDSKKYPFGKETLELFVGIPNNIFLLEVCAMVIVNILQVNVCFTGEKKWTEHILA